ncbi:MAG: restriction endonuclease [Psychrobacillus sp.]
MTGIEFEHFVAELFSKMGYLSVVTKASGDQGIDVIAEKNGRKFGIQSKCYGSKVNNSAVQEVVAGLSYYNCDKGIVVTNNYFTNSAIELAKINNIILWDRDMLKEKFADFFN